MGPWALISQRLDLRPERCPPSDNLRYPDLRYAGNTGLFLGLFDVTRSGAVAGEASVPGVWHDEVNTEVISEVNTEVNLVIIRCKLSRTGPKTWIFSKTGPKYSKTVIFHASSLYRGVHQNVPSFLIVSNSMRFLKDGL